MELGRTHTVSKAEIIVITGAFITYFLAYYGFTEQIEFLPPIASFLAGVFTTAVIQHRFQVEFEKRKIKREDAITMRDKVYGPIFREMSIILEMVESVESGQYAKLESTEELKGIMTHYLFYKMRQDLKRNFYALLDRLDRYERIYHATRTMILKEIRKAVKKAYNVDVQVTLGTVLLRLNLGDITIVLIALEQALLQRMNLPDFIRTKREEWGEKLTSKATIGGQSKNLEDFESLYENVFDEIEGEPFFKEQEKLRKSLVEELEMFLGQIKGFITVQ